MSLHLPDLLRVLAGIFAAPGPLPRADLETAAEAFWISKNLKADLDRLLEAEPCDWPVVYADHFLVSRAHPLLYLEASVHRTGLLQDPALLHDLDHHYEAFGFDVPEGRSPDHLAIELEALAAGLERLGGTNEEELAHLVANLTGLIDLHLLPLLRELTALSRFRTLHPAYAAALAAATSSVDLVRVGIFAFTD